MHQLKVNQQQSIVALHAQGWSKRRIARELGLDRGTVRKYLVAISKPATPHTGSAESLPSKPASNPHTGSEEAGHSKTANKPATRDCGPASCCDPLREQL